MLQEIVRNGSPAQRDLALQTIITSEQMRGQRRAMRSMAVYMGKAASASTGNKQRSIYDAKMALNYQAHWCGAKATLLPLTRPSMKPMMGQV
jgi:hypothetical protein